MRVPWFLIFGASVFPMIELSCMFFWVSAVQTLVWALGGIDDWFFVINEVALFIVLIFVKHRVPVPWATHD